MHFSFLQFGETQFNLPLLFVRDRIEQVPDLTDPNFIQLAEVIKLVNQVHFEASFKDALQVHNMLVAVGLGLNFGNGKSINSLNLFFEDEHY